jgi:hypothetical protein
LVSGDGVEFHIRAMGTGSTASDPLEKEYEEMARLKFNAVTVFHSYKGCTTKPSRRNTSTSAGNDWSDTLLSPANMVCGSSYKC